jgi:hypothetical protein
MQGITKPYQVVIGIDSGTKTGFAQYDKRQKRFTVIETVKIHTAMFRIRELHAAGTPLLVVVEDARQATFNRSNSKDMHRAQGAGSVKRDAAIWQDFLDDENIQYLLRRPDKAKTKWPAKVFQQATGFTGRTSEHARDAAIMILGY